MKYNDRIQYKNQLISAYNLMMYPIYKEWSSKYSDGELKIETIKILNQHILDKIRKSITARHRRIKKIKKENLDSMFDEIQVQEKENICN